MQVGKMRDDLKTEITSLGLNYRIMTQFTSFVAVEDSLPGDGVEPRRVDVPVESTTNSTTYPGAVASMVTVTSQACTVSVSACTSIVSTQTVQSLPIQGRSVQGLFLLSPGTAAPAPGGPLSSSMMSISANGQRPASNSFIIDGVSADFGISASDQSPGASASGGSPALTATGGTSPPASLDAAREVMLRTYSSSAEYGRNSGGQISIVTKAGTNQFHGSATYLFNHEALDANDWFGNSRGLSKPPHRLNDFAGTIGGPIQRDRTFFFLTYAGLRLRQPVVGISDVPSLTARLMAPASTQPLLNLYPLPNGPDGNDGFAEFAASFANSGRHDAVSLRIDNAVNTDLMLSGYINFTDSRANERGAGGFSLNTLNRIFNRAETFTGIATYTFSPVMVGEIRVNYSHFKSRSSYSWDSFGGAVLPPDSLFSQSALFSQRASFSADLNGRSTNLLAGSDVASTQRQFNTVGSITRIVGTHTIKFGADYRRMSPIIGLRQQERTALFDGVTQALTGQAARVNLLTHTQPQKPVFNQFSAYVQDQWKITSKVTLTYGLRWELSRAPNSSDERNALAVTETSDPAQLTLAPAGTSLWATRYLNFAPRVNVAYSPLDDDGLIIRGGFGILYDVTNRAIGDAFADSYPFLNGQSQLNVPFSFAGPTTTPTAPAITLPFAAFDPGLKLPYTLEWNLSLQRALGRSQSITATYLGTAGKRLLLTTTLLDQNPNFEFLRLTDNRGSSRYDALQLQFERRFANRLGAQVSYTWANSRDNFSEDSAARALFRSSDARLERGPSDFDVRHTLVGFISYDIPDPFAGGLGNVLFRNWGIDSAFNVRSAGPVNVVYAIPNFGFIYLRPDLVGGTPLYLNDASAAGGRRINAAAFAVPANLRQGTLGRNALRGFPVSQLNLGLRRRFNFTEDVRLMIGAQAVNVFNHPNFASPAGNDSVLGARFDPHGSIHQNLMFGQSFTNAARSAWGIPGSSFGANYYPGGARSLTFSAKLVF
jgi:hypothetical protein